MLLKILLVILLIAMVASLTKAFQALSQDKGKSGRMLKWLAIRVSLAVAIIVVIVIGFVTGEFGLGAPWAGQY